MLAFFGGNDLEEIGFKELFTTNAMIAAAPKWEEQLKNASRDELTQLPWIYPEPLCIYHRFIKDVLKIPSKNLLGLHPVLLRIQLLR